MLRSDILMFLDFSGLLLRVAKMFEEDDRPRFDYLEQYRYYLNRIKPILGSYVLHQELVSLESSGIIDSINSFLRSINSTRTPKFRDSYVEESKLGFLVEDMRPDGKNPGRACHPTPQLTTHPPQIPPRASLSSSSRSGCLSLPAHRVTLSDAGSVPRNCTATSQSRG